MVQSHISSFVRALNKPKPTDTIRERNQYVIFRGQDHARIWKDTSQDFPTQTITNSQAAHLFKKQHLLKKGYPSSNRTRTFGNEFR